MYRSVTDGALGHGDLERLAALAVLVLALAVHAVVGPAVRMVAEGEQRGDVAVGDEPDVAALAAVATVRATNATGPSRRNDTQPAPPSPPRTFSWHFVDELRLIGPLEATGHAPSRPALAGVVSA